MLSKLIITLYVLTTSGALVLIKLGSNGGALVSFAGSKLVFNFNLVMVMGGLLYATSFLLYMFLISKHDLGYIVPLTTGLVYILIFVASFFIFKESFTAMKIFAIALIIVGVILLNLKG
jgi:multidrug transporter EmrE-like cation transporter